MARVTWGRAGAFERVGLHSALYANARHEEMVVERSKKTGRAGEIASPSSPFSSSSPDLHHLISSSNDRSSHRELLFLPISALSFKLTLSLALRPTSSQVSSPPGRSSPALLLPSRAIKTHFWNALRLSRTQGYVAVESADPALLSPPSLTHIHRSACYQRLYTIPTYLRKPRLTPRTPSRFVLPTESDPRRPPADPGCLWSSRSSPSEGAHRQALHWHGRQRRFEAHCTRHRVSQPHPCGRETGPALTDPCISGPLPEDIAATFVSFEFPVTSEAMAIFTSTDLDPLLMQRTPRRSSSYRLARLSQRRRLVSHRLTRTLRSEESKIHSQAVIDDLEGTAAPSDVEHAHRVIGEGL